MDQHTSGLGPYLNIWDWMERTGTNQTALSKRTKIERSFLVKILAMKRKCSLANALNLSYVTGVPVEKLFHKPHRDRKSQKAAAA